MRLYKPSARWRRAMLTERLHRFGLRAWHTQLMSLGSIGLCITLWIRAKTVDQDERGNAERRALFVGLWPPMFWLIGDTIERQEAQRRSATWGLRRHSLRFPQVAAPKRTAVAFPGYRQIRERLRSSA
jgi:hypothetical protein